MTQRAVDSVFHQIFRGIGGGKRVAVMINAYFDESAESDNQKDGILTVSGYALDAAGLDGLVPEWKAMNGKYNLPYFHMTECNACTGVFGHLSCAQCDECARLAIRLARTYPLHGYSMVVNQSVYRNILQDNGFDCDPYTFMVWTAAIHVEKWVRKNRPDEAISLFFEEGYKAQRQASDLLEAVSSQSRFKRVASRSFVKKEFSEPTQAADLIAWHIRKGYQNKAQRKAIRKDTLALFQDRKIYTIEYTPERLQWVRDNFCEKVGSLANASRSLFSSSDLDPEPASG